MIAPIAAALQPHFLAGRCGESLDHFRRDGLMSGAVEHGFGAFRVGFRLITKDFQTGDALFQRRIVEVGAGKPPLSGAEVIDARGLHVYPGLIDANTVVGLTEISSVPGSVDTSETGDLNPNANTSISVNPAPTASIRAWSSGSPRSSKR